MPEEQEEVHDDYDLCGCSPGWADVWRDEPGRPGVEALSKPKTHRSKPVPATLAAADRTTQFEAPGRRWARHQLKFILPFSPGLIPRGVSI